MPSGSSYQISKRQTHNRDHRIAAQKARSMTDKIRAIIADDEPIARRGIRQMLAQHDDIVVVAETRNGRESVRALRAIKPDLVFLDVQMPGLDGFEVLRRAGIAEMPAIIFVTARDEFAVRAFDANALDYLLKPLR